MSEEPLKLLTTRAERYPQPTEADIVVGTARAALAAIPFVGGSITEILSMVLAPAVTRRRDEWFRELAVALDQLEAKVEGFKVENLIDNEIFISATIQATRAAASTHQAEKREALRNAVLNTALGQTPEEDQILMFLRYVEELTSWHVRFLQLFQAPVEVLTSKGVQFNSMGGVASGSRRFNYTMGGPSVVLELAYPELQGRREFYDQIAGDLRSRGLLNSPGDFLHTTMSANGMLSKRTTATADAFLGFIKSPLPA